MSEIHKSEEEEAVEAAPESSEEAPKEEAPAEEAAPAEESADEGLSEDEKAFAEELFEKNMKKFMSEYRKDRSAGKGVDLGDSTAKATNDYQTASAVGLASGKSLSELNFHDTSDAPDADWKQIMCDLLQAMGRKQYSWLEAYDRRSRQEFSTKTVTPQQEGVDRLGGYLVPEQFVAELQTLAQDSEAIFPRARQITMSGLTMELPTQASLGPRFVNTNETAEKSTCTVEYGLSTLTAQKAACIVPLSDEVIADARIDIMEDIIRQFGLALWEYRDDAFINGSGTINGIDSFTFTQVDAGGTLDGDDFIDAYDTIKEFYQGRAVWLMSKTVFSQVRQLKVNSESNNYLIPWGETNPTIQGRPVVATSFMPDDKIFFIDLNTYVVGVRQGMTVDVSNEATLNDAGTPYSFFERDMTGIRVVVRYAGTMPITEGTVELTNI